MNKLIVGLILVNTAIAAYGVLIGSRELVQIAGYSIAAFTVAGLIHLRNRPH